MNLHILKTRREQSQQNRINEAIDTAASSIIEHIAEENVGDLHVGLGKPPSNINPGDFLSHVASQAIAAVETRTPIFAGHLEYDPEASRLASTENVDCGDHHWRNDTKKELTLILRPIVGVELTV